MSWHFKLGLQSCNELNLVSNGSGIVYRNSIELGPALLYWKPTPVTDKEILGELDSETAPVLSQPWRFPDICGYLLLQSQRTMLPQTVDRKDRTQLSETCRTRTRRVSLPLVCGRFTSSGTRFEGGRWWRDLQT